jgi:hypothetical protein
MRVATDFFGIFRQGIEAGAGYANLVHGYRYHTTWM